MKNIIFFILIVIFYQFYMETNCSVWHDDRGLVKGILLRINIDIVVCNTVNHEY